MRNALKMGFSVFQINPVIHFTTVKYLWLIFLCVLCIVISWHVINAHKYIYIHTHVGEFSNEQS